MRVRDRGGEWPEEARAQLDQQHAELQPEGSQPVAPGGAEALDQTFRAELAQVVAQLAEVVLGLGELLAGQDPSVELGSGPVTGEGGRMEQRLPDAGQPGLVPL